MVINTVKITFPGPAIHGGKDNPPRLLPVVFSLLIVFKTRRAGKIRG